MLILQRKRNQSIQIGDDITITVASISSDKVRIAIDAPKSVSITRSELIEAARSNQEAAVSNQDAVAKLTAILNQDLKEL